MANGGLNLQLHLQFLLINIFCAGGIRSESGGVRIDTSGIFQQAWIRSFGPSYLMLRIFDVANNIQTLAYQAPVLRAHGTLEAMTHGASTGHVTDAAFPSGTAIADMTFS